jgi:aminoglycoside phosphotransferase (APT) family kinase protein
LPNDDATARAVLAALHMATADLSRLGSGFASEVWLVRDAGHAYALRIALDPADWVCTYPAEHNLMARLGALGARVPAPIAGSWQLDGWPLAPFSLTSFIAGVPLRAEAHGWAAGRIAAFLRLLHSIPATGFGPLVEVDGQLVGRSGDRPTGLAATFEGYPLWPFGGARLAAHPALAERRELRARIDGQARTVTQAALDGPAVVVHSDLHEENILQDGRRIGFIDFGESFVGSADWDFAALAYFGGWLLAERTLAAYLSDEGDFERRRASIAAVSLSFGLFRWQQDRRMGVDDEAHDESFLRESLARIQAPAAPVRAHATPGA